MRIEAKSKLKDKPADKFYDLEVGDQITVPDEIGAYWVANGWVKNLDTDEDNPPSKDPVTLDVHNSKIGLTNTGV